MTGGAEGVSELSGREQEQTWSTKLSTVGFVFYLYRLIARFRCLCRAKYVALEPRNLRIPGETSAYLSRLGTSSIWILPGLHARNCAG